LPAKALAYAMGADYLEQDVVASADDELIVLHDVYLDRVSNVKTCFPTRHRDDGRYYVRDFTLRELRSLRVHERQNADGSVVYPGRYHDDGQTFGIQTLAEELQFIAQLTASGGRPVGIYPEIKRPAWHRREGVDISPLFLQVLADFGFKSRQDPIYVQCFDAAELRCIRHKLGSDLKLIQLIGENSWEECSTDYNQLRTSRGLRRLARTVEGIGPWVERLYRQRGSHGRADTGLAARAHAAGLAVHPYTFRSDDLPPGFATFAELLHFVVNELCVDGLFTDFPDQVRKECEKF
jgi:glycerophosphoryl diester phosphodiesterase